MKRNVKYLSLLPLYCIVLLCFLLAGFGSSYAVTVFTEKGSIERKHCVIIDAGHGGVDGGAISCTGIPESKYNLEIALRTEDLMHLLGINTKMIRRTDCSIYTKGETIAAKKVSDLKERVRIVNETDYGILVSIHQNLFSDSRYSGAQVFYATTADSDVLAKTIQKQLVLTLNPGSNRKAKKASGVYLMEKINTTGVLVECGFLSNTQEEARLRNEEYQKKLCCVIGVAVSDYISQKSGQT